MPIQYKIFLHEFKNISLFSLGIPQSGGSSSHSVPRDPLERSFETKTWPASFTISRHWRIKHQTISLCGDTRRLWRSFVSSQAVGGTENLDTICPIKIQYIERYDPSFYFKALIQRCAGVQPVPSIMGRGCSVTSDEFLRLKMWHTRMQEVQRLHDLTMGEINGTPITSI